MANGAARRATGPRCATIGAIIEGLERRIVFSGSLAAAYVPPTSPRVDLDLDSTWKFHKGDASGASGSTFNDSTWSNVIVPHTWNAQDGQDGGNDYYRGTSWYRRHFAVDSTLSNKRFILKFDGACLTSSVYVNGTLAGSHQGAYSSFAYDITALLKIGGDNVFAVKVNNADNGDVSPVFHNFTMFGGLYRDVHLLILNRLQVSPLDFASPGVFLKQTNVSSASANLAITTDLRNQSSLTKNATVKTLIVDAAGNVIKTLSTPRAITSKTTTPITQSTTITSPHLWNGRSDPYLYTVYTQIYDGTTLTDQITQPLGLRSFRVDPNQGFILNGKVYDLHGASLHQDRLDKGTAISDKDRRQDVDLLKEIGATGVRLVHGAHDSYTLDLLDRAGLVAWSQAPNVSTITDSSAFRANANQQLQEMIRQNYNHPSIVFWALASEQFGSTLAQQFVTSLNTLAHTEDPTRITTLATNQPDSNAINRITDSTGFDKYFGWYGGSPRDIGGWMDNLHAAYPSMKIGVSEYGAGGSIIQHQDDPPIPTSPQNSRVHPEEYESKLHEQTWAELKKRPFLWSKLLWELTDSASDNRKEGDTLGRIDKGLITFDRKTKKDAFYFYKANWSSDPVLYLASRRFTQRTISTTNVTVYSNCSSVSVSINGVTLGSKIGTNGVFRWTGVTLSPGGNVVTATGARNGVTSNDTCTWTLATARTASYVAAAPQVRPETTIEKDRLISELL